MAGKRMFAKTIIDSDAFLDMPSSTQSLYFHLSMRADDEGFINNPKKIQRMVGGSDDDTKLLIAKKFIIPFESGIVVIKHWKIHNYIRADRIKETVYQDEKNMIETKDNDVYTLKTRPLQEVADKWQTSGRQVADKCPHSIDKIRLDKVRLDKSRDRHQYGDYSNVLLTDADYKKVMNEFPTDYQERIERLSEYMASTGKSYKNHLATIRSWARRGEKQNTQKKESNPFDELLMEELNNEQSRNNSANENYKRLLPDVLPEQ